MSNFIGVTLTGIDQSTDLDRAIELSHRHEMLEWGVLLGGTPSPRYPSISFIQAWANRANREGVPAALHLCGRFARAWIDNDPEIVALASQFGRIQVNVVAARINVDALIEAVRTQRHPNVITQHNDANQVITDSLSDVPTHSILFDASGGRGVGPEQWPSPVPGKVCGYAGGMGPQNVREELYRIATLAQKLPFWIDMEGRVRTPEDTLALDACDAVLSEVGRFLGHSPSRVGPAP